MNTQKLIELLVGACVPLGNGMVPMLHFWRGEDGRNRISLVAGVKHVPVDVTKDLLVDDVLLRQVVADCREVLEQVVGSQLSTINSQP